MNEAKNLACPFCGHHEIEVQKIRSPKGMPPQFHAICVTCQATSPFEDSEEGAIERWKERAGGRQPEPSATGETKHVCISDLLGGVESLTKPDYHKLNVHAGRNDRLLHAVLCAYAKHWLNCEDIGWERLGEILHAAICENIGDESFCQWHDKLTNNMDNN